MARLRRGIVSFASAVAPPVLLQVCAPCTLLAARVQLLSCLLLQLCAPSTSFLLVARMQLKNCLKGATLAQLYDVCLVMASAKWAAESNKLADKKISPETRDSSSCSAYLLLSFLGWIGWG